jgi:hypothetical protein
MNIQRLMIVNLNTYFSNGAIQCEIYCDQIYNKEFESAKRYLCIYLNLRLAIMSFFFNLHSGGWNPNGSTRHVGHWMAYCTCPGWNEDWQEKPKYSEKTYPSATLSTTNPTWPDPGLKPGRRGGKPETNRLSYGAANLRLAIMSWLHP